MERYFIGADPDLHTPAIAIVNDESKPIFGAIIEVPKAKGTTAVERFAQGTGGNFLPMLIRCATDDFPDAILGHVRALAVEGQEVAYTAKQGANPRDLIPLAQMAGVLAAFLLEGMAIRPEAFRMPRPQEWKGNVPKKVHHERIMTRLGVKYEKVEGQGGYCCTSSGEIKHGVIVYRLSGPGEKKTRSVHKSDWKHLTDAFGLALWAKTKVQHEEAKKLALSRARS